MGILLHKYGNLDTRISQIRESSSITKPWWVPPFKFHGSRWGNRHNFYLVGGIPTPLKNMKVNWDNDIPNIWENEKCSKPPTRLSAFGSRRSSWGWKGCIPLAFVMAKATENHARKPLSYDGTNMDILPTQAGLCITVPNLWVAAVDLVVNAIAGNPIFGYYMILYPHSIPI